MAYGIKDLFGVLVIVSVNVINLTEYLDYKNCRCNKMLVNKLVEECTENIEETRLAETNSIECNFIKNKCKHNSCTLYIALFLIIFTVNIGIGSYFFNFYWYLKKDAVLQQQFNELINGKSQTNRDQKSNLSFLQQHDQSQKFQIKLVKN